MCPDCSRQRAGQQVHGQCLRDFLGWQSQVSQLLLLETQEKLFDWGKALQFHARCCISQSKLLPCGSSNSTCKDRWPEMANPGARTGSCCFTETMDAA